MARVKNLTDQAKHLGWGRTVQLRAAKRLGVPEIRLKVPGLRHKVAVRVADSDIYDFNHSLAWGREPLNLGFTPRTIVDAGANVGYSVLRFLLEYPEARIVAIEPDAGNLAQIVKNCATYRNLIVEPHALWTHRTRLKITNPEEGSNAFQVAEDPNGSITSISIPDIIERHSIDMIDLLKVDIEGSEIEVFSDSDAWLPKVRALLVETHDCLRPGTEDAVKRATQGRMMFQRHVGEYAFYLAA
ncbi:MAG TPA: FkbM family methyltransferase [Sphingomicrobium sp.]|nr:FkbM family methyltransferase [Sphingomicrobium sp.]